MEKRVLGASLGRAVLTRFWSLMPYIHHLPLAQNPSHPPHRVAFRSLTQGFRSRSSQKSGIMREAAWQRVLAWKVRVGLLDVGGDCYRHFHWLNMR